MEFLWQRHLVEENATDKKSKNIWGFCVCVLSLCIQSRFCVCETHCVRVWLMQPLVSRVHSLQGALDLCSSFCSAAQRVCDLERVGHTHRERLDSYTVLQYCLLLYGSENSYQGAAFSSADINKPPKHPWTCCFQVCSCNECRETEREGEWGWIQIADFMGVSSPWSPECLLQVHKSPDRPFAISHKVVHVVRISGLSSPVLW